MTMTADALLAIPTDAPYRLFPSDADKAEALWRRLAKRWHPDAAGNADVFTHITTLKSCADHWRAAGRWEEADALTLTGTDGRTRRLRFLRRHATAEGETLIARTAYTELTDTAHADLAENAATTIAALRFANERMRAEMTPWLPQQIARFDTPTQAALVLKKPREAVLLSDLLAHAPLAPEHIGWIISGMLHVACYLEFAGLAHNAIGPDTYVVSPATHSGALLGGWGYAAKSGTRLRAAPARTVAAAPSVWKREKIATGAMDRELIRLTARDAGPLPDPLARWVETPPPTRAVDDYAAWKTALRDAFGRPRFVTLPTTPEDIYAKET